jgi:hypothetical protein
MPKELCSQGLLAESWAAPLLMRPGLIFIGFFALQA